MVFTYKIKYSIYTTIVYQLILNLFYSNKEVLPLQIRHIRVFLNKPCSIVKEFRKLKDPPEPTWHLPAQTIEKLKQSMTYLKN